MPRARRKYLRLLLPFLPTCFNFFSASSGGENAAMERLGHSVHVSCYLCARRRWRELQLVGHEEVAL